MEHTAVRKNKVTSNIFDIKNVKNGEEQMENQIIQGYKTEKNVSISKKRGR